MSGDAKRFRALSGSAGRHGDSFWVEEQNNIGMKLLKGMGWQQGSGLGKTGQGRTVVVKQRLKKDNAGIGAKANTRDEAFVASQDLFSDVLARLNAGTNGSGGGGAAPESSSSLGTAATTITGALARRQMVKRFCRAEPISDKAKAMDQIFGRKSDSKEEEGGAGGESQGEHPTSSDGPQTTSAVSVSDYFAQRRKQLGIADAAGSAYAAVGWGAGAGVGAATTKSFAGGFSLDDQAAFAENQKEAAYSGRRGLGAKSGGGDDGSDDEVRAAALARFAPPAYAKVAPPRADSSSSSKEDRKAAKRAEKEAKKAAKKATKEAAKEAAAAQPTEQTEAEAKAARKAAKKAAKKEAKKATAAASDEEAAKKERKAEKKRKRAEAGL